MRPSPVFALQLCTSFGGFNQTLSILFQFLIAPDQRAGFFLLLHYRSSFFVPEWLAPGDCDVDWALHIEALLPWNANLKVKQEG